MERYLKETKMLDFSNETIQRLIKERKWNEMAEEVYFEGNWYELEGKGLCFL